jgi:hypothetical protein
LPLLVTRIRTDNVHHAATADDLAILTNPLDAGANLHGDEPFYAGHGTVKAHQYSRVGQIATSPYWACFPVQEIRLAASAFSSATNPFAEGFC